MTAGSAESVEAGSWPADGLEGVAACPVCGGAARDAFFDGLTDRVFFQAPGRWTLYRCRGCTAAYLDPRPSPDTLHLAYRDYYTHRPLDADPTVSAIPLWRFRLALRNGLLNGAYGYDLRPSTRLGRVFGAVFPFRAARETRFVRHLAKPASEPPRLLDVGCGNGRYLARMRSLGWQAEGIEPDPAAVASAREARLTIHQGTLATFDGLDGSFDAITMAHVIEHLHDPRQDLRACFRLLRPGGILWISTPNLDASGRRRFGESWRGLEPPRHLVLFNRSSLARLAREVGFHAITPPPLTAVADFYFRASAAIASGVDPMSPPPLTRQLRARVRLADIRAAIRPDTAEELVSMFRKPA